MERKEFRVIDTLKCKYVYDKRKQKLMSMKPVDVTFNLETGEVAQYFNLGGESQIAGVDINSEFYASEESFKLGAKIPAESAISVMTTESIMKKLFDSIKTDEVGPFVWVYENGEATKWRLEEHTKNVYIDYNDKKHNVIDCPIPETYYSVEEVYMYNDYTVQDEDGKSVVREGVYKRLILTDEQNALVDKLEAVIKECKNAGIALEFDTCDYELMAFNTNNIKEYTYDPMYDESKESAYMLILGKAGRCVRGVSDINTGDDCFQFVIEKTEE